MSLTSVAKPNASPPELGADSAAFARALGISREAVELTRESALIDLHIDTLIPQRLVGYDLARDHHRPLGGRFFGHLDFPRIERGGLSAAMWSITTNPLRSKARRYAVFLENVTRLRALLERTAGKAALVRDHPGLVEAIRTGKHAALLSIQGGHALEAVVGTLDLPDLVRVTLVHLTNSGFGASSSPAHHLRRHKGLTARGKAFVEQLDQARIFVDLAHIHPAGFWDAVEVHDRSLPLLATHTGVSGVRPHWRNLDDAQLKAIANSGGTIGIIFSQHFLCPPGAARDGRIVAEHMDHIIRVVGDDFVSIGSDYDGMIIPPDDLRSGERYACLVEHLLQRGYRTERIQKILGQNFLRAFRLLRPGAGS